MWVTVPREACRALGSAKVQGLCLGFLLLLGTLPLQAGAPLRLALVPQLTSPTDTTLPALGQALAATGEEQSGFIALSGPGKPARRATAFRIAWTETALCLTVTCPLAGGPPFASNVMDRDGTVWTDDCLELFLQPAGEAGYYHFGWNPAGTQSDERGQDLSWDAPWRVLSTVTAEAWTSVVVIPFAAIGGPPATQSFWRFNLCRSDTANREYSSWSFSGGGFHRPDRFGWLIFLAETAGATGIPPEPLPAELVERLRKLFYPAATIAAARAEIATFLRAAVTPPAAAAAPVLNALRQQVETADKELAIAADLFSTLDRAKLAPALAKAGTVPEICRRAEDGMYRWRIEQLLRSNTKTK